MNLKQFRDQIYFPMDTPQNAASQFLRNCLLFLKFPTDFLFTFSDPLDTVPDIKDINEEAHTVGMNLLKELKGKASGGMRVYFFGSNFFKLPGINDDIDFLVEYGTDRERERWEALLTARFGKPLLQNRKFTKWETMHEGFQIEILLSHPKFQIFRTIYDGYNALCSDPQLLEEYEQLKHSSVGVSLREYNRRQMYFFRYYAKQKMAGRV